MADPQAAAPGARARTHRLGPAWSAQRRGQAWEGPSTGHRAATAGAPWDEDCQTAPPSLSACSFWKRHLFRVRVSPAPAPPSPGGRFDAAAARVAAAATRNLSVAWLWWPAGPSLVDPTGLDQRREFLNGHHLRKHSEVTTGAQSSLGKRPVCF